jgi:hypothetical protein
MHLHRKSDTSVAHWKDTVKVRQRTSWPAGGTGSSLVQTIYGACGTICNDVQCPNAVGGSRHIHSNHVKCLPACHGRRTRMQRSVASCAFTAPPPASCPAAACFSLGRPSAATSELPNHVARQALAFKRYMLKPGQATSWPERVARQGRRRTFDTSHQVKKSVVS